jgi:hypothetical protein
MTIEKTAKYTCTVDLCGSHVSGPGVELDCLYDEGQQICGWLNVAYEAGRAARDAEEGSRDD